MYPLVSVVTPTFERVEFLKKCFQYFRTQDYPNLEWLILDDSPQPITGLSNINRHIRYIHSEESLNVGEKRNLLAQEARGEIIIHFDDDDYYHPSYISTVLKQMFIQKADAINLRGWYLLDLRAQFFGYWDLTDTQGLYYRCSGDSVTWGESNEAFQESFKNNYLGYGFGYAYKKSIWEKIPFESVSFNEDSPFMMKAQESFRVSGFKDESGICLHYLHPQSSSICFPQYHLPLTALNQLFPNIIS
jgi:glycosyltransferase involved in cell wall biosynthesis